MPPIARSEAGLYSVSVESFLLDITDVLNSTFDVDTLLTRISDSLRQIIDFDIFAIMLLNEKTQELRMRFHFGHSPEVDKIRVKVGKGVTGKAVELREPILVADVTQFSEYIAAHPSARSELAVPLITKNRVIGVIDIQSRELNYFNEYHKKLLTLVASRIATAIENARLYTRVAKQAQNLSVLNEISRELTSILNVDELLKRIGESLSRVIDYQMFSILLLDEFGTKLQHRFSVRFKENIQLKHDIPLAKGLVGAAASSGQAVLVPDVAKDPRYIKLNDETRSELCVPLIYKDKVIGVLDLEHTKRGYFNEDHLRTITTMAGQIAIAIENARLYERIAKEERRLERELDMAREVQTHLLPGCCPKFPGGQLAARFIPAYQIGGDIYDFHEYSGGRLGIAIGDVSGKGAPAALFAALVGGIMRSTAVAEPSPAEMLATINAALNERQISGQFVSIIYAVWDNNTQTMTVANSGLPRPIFCRNGGPQMIQAAGLPLGLFEDAEYDEISIKAEPDDVFLFFSDGIVDAENRDRVQFSRSAVEKIVGDTCGGTAEDIVQAIFNSVCEHVNGVAPFDDQTVVAFKVTPVGSPAADCKSGSNCAVPGSDASCKPARRSSRKK